MRWGLEKADLRRAALRGVAVACLPAGFGVWLVSLGPTPAPVAAAVGFVTNLICIAGVIALLSLIEFRAAAQPPAGRRGGCSQVWIAGLFLWPLVMLQSVWTEGAVRQRSLEAGMIATWDAIAVAVTNPGVLIVVVAYSFPWAILSAARLQDRHPPILMVMGWTGVLASPFFCLGGFLVWLILMILMPGLHLLYAAADYVDARLARRFVGGEVAALQRHLDAEELTWAELWVLAYVDHEPARQFLGPRAPARLSELDAWVRRIATGTIEPLLHATAAALRLTRVGWDEHPAEDPAVGEAEARAFAAVDRWDVDPGPATLAEAKDALAALDEASEKPRREAEAAREALVAITTKPGGWSKETIRMAASRVAHLAARRADEETTREVIRSAVVAWLLSGRQRLSPSVAEPAAVEPVSPLGPAEPPADDQGDVEQGGVGLDREAGDGEG